MKDATINRTNKKHNRLMRDLENLNFEIPSEVKKRFEDNIYASQEEKPITISSFNKELKELVPTYRKSMRLSMIFACAGEILCFASYFFSAYAGYWILSKVSAQQTQSLSQLFLYGFIALVALLLSLILKGLSSIISHKCAFNTLGILREKLYEKINKIPAGYLVNHSAGSIKSIIVESVAACEDWIAHVIPELPGRMLHPILATIILFILDWRLGMSLLAPFPLLAIGFAIAYQRGEARQRLWNSSYAEVNARTLEFIRGIPVIKAFLHDNSIYSRYIAATNFYHDSTMAWWKQSWPGMAIVSSTLSVSNFVTLPLAFLLYFNGQIPAYTFIMALILPMAILPNAYALTMSLEVFTMVTYKWREIRTLLYHKEFERPDDSQRKKLDNSKGAEFDDVCFSYEDGTEVLHHVSFTAEKNKVTAIVGPSGSGKSTVARLLASYWDQDSGFIRLGGQLIKDLPYKQLMEEISYVSQENFLFNCSIRENISLSKPDATEEEIVEAAKAAHAHEFIMKLPNAYDTNGGDAGSKLSGGERQRIALARAFLKPANMIILDEATAYADPENEVLIQDSLLSLIQGKSLLVVAHRLNTVIGADKIIVLEKGRVVGEGRHEELLKSCHLYARLWAPFEKNNKKDMNSFAKNEQIKRNILNSHYGKENL